jgi:hypothetical protein
MSPDKLVARGLDAALWLTTKILLDPIQLAWMVNQMVS